MTNSKLYLKSSTFRNNYGYTAGVIELDNEAYLQAKDSTFASNTAVAKAGVINLVTKSHMSIYNSIFSSNIAQENSVINCLESSEVK